MIMPKGKRDTAMKNTKTMLETIDLIKAKGRCWFEEQLSEALRTGERTTEEETGIPGVSFSYDARHYGHPVCDIEATDKSFFFGSWYSLKKADEIR